MMALPFGTSTGVSFSTRPRKAGTGKRLKLLNSYRKPWIDAARSSRHSALARSFWPVAGNRAIQAQRSPPPCYNALALRVPPSESAASPKLSPGFKVARTISFRFGRF
jgi:hypothetical protein